MSKSVLVFKSEQWEIASSYVAAAFENCSLDCEFESLEELLSYSAEPISSIRHASWRQPLPSLARLRVIRSHRSDLRYSI